jgi:hypothetical protein
MGTGMTKRRWLLALALAAFAGLTAWLWWDRAHQPPPQIITLPDGRRFRFAGVTYSKKNVPPTFVAHLVSWLPTPLANLAKRYVGTRISQFNEGSKFDTPQLFVWFQYLGTNASAPLPPALVTPFAGSLLGPCVAKLADESGTQAGVKDQPMLLRGMAWGYAKFPVVPKRSRMLELTLSPGPTWRSIVPAQRVRFPNPVYGKYPEWKPEPVPAVKQAGDLDVRLIYFTAGDLAWSPFSPYSSPQTSTTGEDNDTAFRVSIRPSRPGTNTSWILHASEVRDATGNVLRNVTFKPRFNDPITEPRLFEESFPGMLWTNEAAWLLKLDFKKASGFGPGELVAFKNVPAPPVGITNSMSISKTVGDTRVVLKEFHHSQFSSPRAGFGSQIITWDNYLITVELPDKPAGMAIALCHPDVTDKYELVQAEELPGSLYTVNWILIPTNRTTFDLTFVVQKTRSVEFLVAPPKAK